MKLLMLVSNTFESDARVHRSACALAEAGFEVVLLARHRKGLPEREKIAGYEVIRMDPAGPQPGPRASASPGGSGSRFYDFFHAGYRFAVRIFPPLREIVWWALRRLRSVFRGIEKMCSRWRMTSRAFALSAFHQRKLRLMGYVHLVRRYESLLAPDVIHAHDFHCLVAAHEIWKEKKIPFVYDSHELWIERNRLDGVVAEEEKNWEETLEREAIAQAAFSITVCDSIADHLAKHYAIPRPVVLRNTPVRRNAEQVASKSLRKTLGLDPSDFVVLYLGKITYNRGVMDILRAVALLDPRVKFVTLGYFDPRFEADFRKTVKDLAIQNRVFSYGPVGVDEVADWIVDCDLSLTTMNRTCLSYTYALPNKLFESLQAGLPIVGPDSPEIERIVRAYRCGITYRDGDAQNLAERVTALLRSPGELASFRQAARVAGGELCWENEREKLWEAYRKAFPKPSKGTVAASALPQMDLLR